MSVYLSAFAGAGWQLFDNNGVPLSGGLIYTYAAGTSTPATTYTSSSGSIAHSNPIVLDAYGRVPQEIWGTAGAVYKFVLKDSSGSIIGTYDNIANVNDVSAQIQAAIDTVYAQFANTTNPDLGDALVGFRQSNITGNLVGAIGKTVNDKLQDCISVFDFMTYDQIVAVQLGTSTEDLSTPIQNAINTRKAVYLPKGKYHCNVIISNRIIIFGDGNTATIVTPYDNNAAAMLYTYAAMSDPSPLSYWNYHSVVRDIGFVGSSANSGGSVGFSFGTTSPTTYTGNCEYANNVQFYNCNFQNNYIGCNFPHGNIGTAFYSCGFQSNYYGAYLLDNRTGYGGGNMHAGNKYFYNGEMHSNKCAVYCDNQTDGFGAVEFTDVIFEANDLVLWLNNISNVFVPITFRGCWNEANGGYSTGNNTVTLDQWSGNTLSTATISTEQPWIIYNNRTVFDSCFVTGIKLTSDESVVNIKNCRVETSPGVGGSPITATYANSRIYVENSTTQSPLNNSSIICIGNNNVWQTDVTSAYYSTARARFTPLFYKKTTGANKGSGISVDFTTTEPFSGAYSGTGTVVPDGVLYTTCNEVAVNLSLNTQYLFFTNTAVTAGTGWWVTSFNVKVTSSTIENVNFIVWNASTHQMINIGVPNDNKWHQCVGIGYFPSSASVSLWVGGAAQTSTVLISAFQMISFDDEGQANEFIAANTFLE